VISSGETTVRVAGGGKGGRNQEFGLACVDQLAAIDGPAVLASVGTDGVDGPTDAAGAVVDSTTDGRARAARLQPQAFLERNDSYRFFEALGDLVQTGPTGTNVGDLQVILLG
jgi:hydroxypyruvate reductase